MLKETLKKLNLFRYISFSKKTSAPAILYSRFYKLLAFALLSVAILAACLIAQIIFTPFIAVSFGFLAAALFVCAFHYKYSLEQIGYTVIKGKITFVKEGLSPSAESLLKNRTVKRAMYYHLKTADGKTYRFPANKVDDELPAGSMVCLYAPYDVGTYERSGIISLVNIWGYELDSEAEPASDQEEPLT